MSDQDLSLEHPTPDEVALLCSGGVSSDDREALLEHVSKCSTCAGLVSALMPDGGSFPTPQPVIGDADIEKAWSDLEARLPAKTRSPEKPQPVQKQDARSLRPARSLFLPRLAEGFAIGLIGFLLGWVYFSGDTFTDPYIVDLAVGVQRSGQEDLNSTTAPSSAKRLFAIVTLREEVDFHRYQIGVWPAADAAGSPILLEDAERGGPRVSFSLGIQRWKLSPGDYVVKILGFREDTAEPVEVAVTRWKLSFE